jgi:hypothetical protein
LEDAAHSHPELAKWTSQTRTRWAEGFCLVLRELGMLVGSAHNHETLSRVSDLRRCRASPNCHGSWVTNSAWPKAHHSPHFTGIYEGLQRILCPILYPRQMTAALAFAGLHHRHRCAAHAGIGHLAD